MSFSITRRLVVAGALMAAAVAYVAPAAAQTVDEIKSKGKLTVGMLVDFPPFGITTSDGKPDGYDADVAKLLGKHMGVPVEIVPVTGPNRIPYLLTNKVDLLVASLGITAERAKQVQFSEPYAAIEIGLVAPASTKIKDAAELSGKRVGVARASTQDNALTAVAPKDARIMRFDDDASAVQAMLSGQVDALGLSNVVAKEIKKLAPQSNYEMKFVLNRQVQGIAMRQGQDALLKWVNDFIEKTKSNGELNAIHQKWLGTDLPPLTKS
ncbi:transporter substrate-binding domain-containing protein [Azospirillum rugosum]|uniref:Polar amino acid transport system substrate-binding protein n=1 Tax=Azospirillum rugosum TaxID=416170 RepID=A0ABS4SE24_9PROT|nr:transporter substrate-binding domain-containing protein [Azospirillum rugosum]MBP2290826.1 polar amino acid transport system substrate-binding protein [Azospirillum rugosum]MDQ0529693.1 polar amino acid transport system substrate-binding protein [Azospirillum rugosum]